MIDRTKIEMLNEEIRKSSIAIQRALILLDRLEREMDFRVDDKLQIVEKGETK